MASRETENNAYATFWGDKQRALWYVMVFLEWSINSFKNQLEKVDFENLLSEECKKFILPLQRLG